MAEPTYSPGIPLNKNGDVRLPVSYDETEVDIGSSISKIINQYGWDPSVKDKLLGRITDEHMADLSVSNNLRDLDISGCKQLTEETLKYISNPGVLERLDISGTNIDPVALQGHLNTMPNLTYLNATGVLTAESLGGIVPNTLENLKGLAIGNITPGLDDKALERISKLENLESLHISGSLANGRPNNFTAEGIKNLENMPNLKVIEFSDHTALDAEAKKALGEVMEKNPNLQVFPRELADQIKKEQEAEKAGGKEVSQAESMKNLVPKELADKMVATTGFKQDNTKPGETVSPPGIGGNGQKHELG